MSFPGILADGSLVASAASIRDSLGLATDDDVTFGSIIVTNLTVNGTSTTINTASVTVDDPLIRLADNNAADTIDIGLFGLYVSSGSKYAGFFRDATDGKFRLFTGLQEEPTTTVNTAGTGYTAATLVVGTVEATTFTGLPVADGSTAGIISTGAQILAGAKTLTGGILVGSGSTFAVDTSGNLSSTAAVSGSELVSGWTNTPSYSFETLTTSGSTITSAINSSGYAFATAAITVVAGQQYRISFSFTLNSGTAPTFGVYNGTTADVPTTVQGTPSAGTNTYDFTAISSGTKYVTFWCDDGVASNFSVSSFTCKLLAGGAGVYGGPVSAAGGISAPQNTTSERLGAGANCATFTQNVLVGNNAISRCDDAVGIGYKVNVTATGYAAQTYGGQPTIIGSQATGNGTAVGYKAQATNFEAVAIGPQSRASGLATLAIGDAARALPSGPNGNEIVIGDVTWATGNVNLIIGGGCGTAFDYVIGLGVFGATVNYDTEIASANNQGFIGWYPQNVSPYSTGAGLCNDWWLGGPILAQAPHAITLNITSGVGTNIAGVDFTINASRGTGNGAPGRLKLATSTVGSSGTTLQTLSDKIILDDKVNVAADVYPTTDDTYYLGKNDDDTPKAFKGIILKDQSNGKTYRIEMIAGVLTATDLTD